VKIVDTNVLVYAVAQRAPHHRESRAWLDHALGGAFPVGLSWGALLGFIRIATHPRVYDPPLSPEQAMDVVDGWLGARSAHLLQPGPFHASFLRELLAAAGTAGNLTADAHLAALALEHKATIVTFDTDFSRFPGVKWERPR